MSFLVDTAGTTSKKKYKPSDNINTELINSETTPFSKTYSDMIFVLAKKQEILVVLVNPDFFLLA